MRSVHFSSMRTAGPFFKGTERVALSHRAVVLLRTLSDRAGAPASNGALMEAGWPGIATAI
jgi:DNA-binding winged helix-turn-helix (wHTH) protein